MSAPLIQATNLSKSFATRELFREVTLGIFEKDQIGLIGPNGAGKTTLLNILTGLEMPDSGEVTLKKGTSISIVPQDCEFPDESPLKILVDSILEKIPKYEKELLAETWLSRVGIDAKEPSAAILSGGWKKRLGFARALIQSPDVVFFDEPTNHLDLESIEWFEKFLPRFAPTYLLVSHDRYFLNHVTNRIVDLDPTYPKGIISIDGSYAKFLEKKEAFLSGQKELEKSLASKVRRESEWLKSGVKARTTKSQSRIDEAHSLIKEHKNVSNRNRNEKAKISFVSSERETQKLLTAKNLSIHFNDRPLFSNLDFVLSPGSRVGLMGPNGSGKTTLLRMIAGEVQPNSGTIKRAENLKTVYFDQHRTQLPKEMTLKEALCPTGEYVNYQGRSIHVNGWCKRFLFSPERLDLPIGSLSGGERARISIAHLMLQPADLLLLDEPTNDLDIPTLETLEASLIEFPGAICLITHDRCMLDRICTSYIHLSKEKAPPKEEKKKHERPKSKLSYHEKKEYDSIEGRIDQLEKKLAEEQLELEKPQDAKALNETCQKIATLETQIEELYLRFDELDRKKRGE